MRITGAAAGLAVLLLAALAAPASAGVNINVGIGIPVPPVFAISAGPAVVVVPGTPVYYAPGLDVDVFFYGGYWWTPHQGHWFRSPSYNGPWGYMQAPPRAMVHMPPNYRTMVGREKPIPYGQFKKHWREWDRRGGPPGHANVSQTGGHDSGHGRDSGGNHGPDRGHGKDKHKHGRD
jgi:hypothetical protein